MSKRTKAPALRAKPKGGTRFPQHHLGELEKHAEAFARKTATHEINLAQLNASVFGLSDNSPRGQIRLSSMRQYGLVEGRNRALKASPLAHSIAGSQGDERIRLLREAFANVKTFADTFKTFAGDQTDLGKIESYAVAPLGVHPDKAPLFAVNMARSAQACGLGILADDKVSLKQPLDGPGEEPPVAGPDTVGTLRAARIEDGSAATVMASPSTGHAISIQVDSSMDPEKLEKHLQILRRYGLI